MTGEHNCIMICPNSEETSATSSEQPIPTWLKAPLQEFACNFVSQLSGPFRSFTLQLAHNILTIFKDILEAKGK